MNVSPRTLGLGLVGAVLGLGGWLLARQNRGSAEHAAPDLALDRPRPGANDRAPVAFRPDPTAPVPAAERESLRPAAGPSPSLVADRGELRQQTASSNA